MRAHAVLKQAQGRGLCHLSWGGLPFQCRGTQNPCAGRPCKQLYLQSMPALLSHAVAHPGISQERRTFLARGESAGLDQTCLTHLPCCEQ